MNINNNYAALNAYQSPGVNQPIQPLPIEPEQPDVKPGENLSPSERVAVGNVVAEEKIAIEKETVAQEEALIAEDQAQRDATRENVVSLVARDAKQTQAEIYLSVQAGEKVSLGSSELDTVLALRDIQKQNNTVEAYATYQANQNQVLPTNPNIQPLFT